MKIAFNPSTVEALIAPPNNKDITFDLRGQNIFARGVKFCGTDTNTWRDIKINNVSIGSNTLDLRNGSNTTLTNTNGVVTINSTWRPVVDNLTSDSTTSSLSANLGRVLAGLINGKSDSGHTHDDRYLKLTGGTMTGTIWFNNLININSAIVLDYKYSAGGFARDIVSMKNSIYEDANLGSLSVLCYPNSTSNGFLYIYLGTDKYHGPNNLRIYKDKVTFGDHLLIDAGNYSSILDSRYYTESEVNNLLSNKLNISDFNWTNLPDKIVGGNEFNIVNAGFNNRVWFNYLPINDRSKTATITGYSFGNGAQGYASILASGFVKTGSSSSYVLLGDGGHQIISSLSVNHALFADYICEGTLPTPANNTVKAYKDSLVKFFTNYPNGIGANVSVSTSIINQWSNDAATYFDSSSFSVIKISGSYNGTTYGQFLLSSYNLSQVGIVGRNNSQWSKIKWLAFEDQIPTNNNQLTNGAGYITSNGSCAYASSAGNADTLDGNHASAFATSRHTHNYLNAICSGTTINGESGAWSKIESNTDPLKFKVYEVYNDGGPTTYGEVLNVTGYIHHWQAQLWMGSGRGGKLYYRNKEYDDNTWGNWRTVAFTADNVASANYASSAGNADMVDGYHASGLLTSVTNTNNGVSITVGGTTKSVSNINVNGANTILGTSPQIAAATEHNSIYVSSPSYDTNKPVKMLCFDWYGNYWALSNIRSGSTPSAGFGVFFKNTEIARFTSDGNLSCNAASATKLQTPRTIWGQSFDGTGNVDGTLRIRPTINDWCEGIRIQNGDNTWATIILGATSDYGTNANAWSIHRKTDNNFSISRNSSDGINGLVMTSTGMGLGTTAPAYRLDVRGNIYSSSTIRTAAQNQAIVLSNNSGPAWISALEGQVIFNTGNAIRFGETSWDWNQWAGLKYTHSNKTIYLGIADGSAFNANSPQSNGILRLAGITTITPDSGARIGGSGGDLYLGNANNSGWVKVQDMCSQQDSNNWCIYQAGDAYFNTIDINGDAYIVGNLEAGQIIREGSGLAWVNGRNGALLRETSVAGYHTLWSLKTTNGSWDFGEYNSSGWNNIPVLSYITDTNFNSGNNTPTYQIKFPLASGTVALTSDIPNPTDYYWANVKISTSSSTTTSPTVSNLTATDSIKMGNILLEHTNEINNSANGHLYLNLRSSGDILLCYGGGDVGIGTSPFYKLDVAGEMRSWGFHHKLVDSNDYILLAGGGYMKYKTGTTEYSTAILFGKYVWLTILMYNTIIKSQVVPDNISKPTKIIYVLGGSSSSGVSAWYISTDGILYMMEGGTSVTHLFTTICYVAS